MTEGTFQHVFGPVFSRRLGRSLGVDLVPFKTCSYDCVYCQLGRTTEKTVECGPYVPLEEVLAELSRKLDEGHELDYVTLSGSGEPTLFSGLGELISRIKAMTKTPLAVLTNGSLFMREDVRHSLMEADLVIPSLDTGDEDLFRIVNRPHPDITFEKMVEGLIRFGHDFPGSIWLECLLLEGITAFDAEVKRIAAIARKIDPDRVQVGTVVRPPTDEFAHPVSRESLVRFAAAFGEKGEVIGEYTDAGSRDPRPSAPADILALLRRRPCSLQDVARGLNIHPAEASKHLSGLIKEGAIAGELAGGVLFYRPGPKDRGDPRSREIK
jgi:wyosine [tRNA(Phe)-imidazoG37] synthetase (radical SAM superfamily)